MAAEKSKNENLGHTLAKDMVDGLMKQAKELDAQNRQDTQPTEVLDEETRQKLIQREIRMASDPEYEAQQLAQDLANKRMRDKLTAGGAATSSEKSGDEAKKKADEALKLEAERANRQTSLYESCIKNGGDAKTCGELVEKVYGIKKEASAPQATSITDLVNALKTLDELRGSNKTDPALLEILKGMREEFTTYKAELASIKTGGEKTKGWIVVKQDGSVSEVPADGRPLIVEKTVTVTTPAAGESIETLKAKQDHEYKLKELSLKEKEIDNEKESADRRNTVLESIPEMVGKGLASQARESAKAAGKGSDGMEKSKCPECGTTIYSPVGAKEIKCPNPKCGKVLERLPD